MFDPYHKWLGIPKGQRPPTYYQLLGLSPDERDRDVIETATLRQTAFVRNFQSGQHAKECAQVLNELALARLTLVDEAKRSAYDAKIAPQAPKKTAEPTQSPQPPAEHRFTLAAPETETLDTPEVRSFQTLGDIPVLKTPADSPAPISNPSVVIETPKRLTDAPKRLKAIPKPPIAVIAAAIAAVAILPIAIFLATRSTKSSSTVNSSSRRPTEGRDVAIASPSLTAKNREGGSKVSKPSSSPALAPGKNSDVKTPSPKPAVVEVKIEPSNAVVALEGLAAQEIGTPQNGSHRFEFKQADGKTSARFRFESDGFKPSARDFVPKPGESLRLDVTLEPLPKPPPTVVAEPPKTEEIDTILVDDTLPTVRGEALKFVGHEEKLTSIAFGLGGTRVLSASEDRSVRYWETKTGKDLHIFKGFAESVTDVLFAARDASHYFMLTASRDGFVRLHDLKTKRLLFRFESKQARPISGLAIAPDGQNLISLDQNGFHDWELKPPFKELRAGKPDGPAEFTVAAFSPDGASPAIGDSNGIIHIYQRDTTKEIGRVEPTGPASGIAGLAWMGDDRFVAARRDGTYHFCSKNEARPTRKLAIPGGRAFGVAVSPNGSRLVTAHENPDFAIVLWDVSNGRPLKRFLGHQGGVTCVAFSPDGKWILSGGEDHSLRLWDVNAEPAR